MSPSPGPLQADPATRRVLEQIAAAGLPPMHQQTPAQARQAMLDGRVNDIDPPALARIAQHAVPTGDGPLAVRCYYPREASSGAPGILLFFHGGGFVIGDLDTHDVLCRQLCLSGDVLVVAVDYRLAPEHRYPAAVEDAIAAFTWVERHGAELGGDPRRLAVCGDSAGGTLAAVVAQHARDRQVPLRAQVLLYPVVDLSAEYPSHREQSDIYPIPTAVLNWFWSHYLGPGASADTRAQPWASPMRGASLEGLAPAFVLTAGLDPLRDEGDAYARGLSRSGVETVHHCVLGTIHGFLRLGRLIPAAPEAIAAAGTFVRTRMGPAGPP